LGFSYVDLNLAYFTGVDILCR